MASMRNDDPPVFSVGANSDKQPIARADTGFTGRLKARISRSKLKSFKSYLKSSAADRRCRCFFLNDGE